MNHFTFYIILLWPSLWMLIAAFLISCGAPISRLFAWKSGRCRLLTLRLSKPIPHSSENGSENGRTESWLSDPVLSDCDLWDVLWPGTSGGKVHRWGDSTGHLGHRWAKKSQAAGRVPLNHSWHCSHPVSFRVRKTSGSSTYFKDIQYFTS